jgi:hypothetical protein
MLDRGTVASVFELDCSTLASLLSATLLGWGLPVLIMAACCVDNIPLGFLTSVKVCEKKMSTFSRNISRHLLLSREQTFANPN